MNVNTISPKKTASVPIRSRAKVLRRFTAAGSSALCSWARCSWARCSWERAVGLPLTDELDEEVDLRLCQHRCLVLDDAGTARVRSWVVVIGDTAPVGHDAAVVLEVGEAVHDAAVVVILVEVAKTVLVVERRTRAAFAEATVTASAVLVVQL